MYSVDPHLGRLVEAGRVEGDRGRRQDPVIAAGVARDDVVDDDAALDELDRRVREIGRRRRRRASSRRSCKRPRRARRRPRPSERGNDIEPEATTARRCAAGRRSAVARSTLGVAESGHRVGRFGGGRRGRVGVGRGRRGRGAGGGRGRRGSRRCPSTSAAAAAGPDSATRRRSGLPVAARPERFAIAARDSLVRARPLAASIPSAVAVRGPAARRRRPIPPTQPRAAASSRRPSDIRRRAMSSGHRSSARTRSSGHKLGEPVGGGQVVPPRVERRGDDRPAGRRPQRGEERLVGAELPVLGRGLGDQPDRPPERRRPRPGLGHPDRVRPRLDLAERRLVDPGRDLDEAHRRAARGRARRRSRSSRRSRVAIRPLRRSRREARSCRRSSRTSPRCRRSPRPGRSS